MTKLGYQHINIAGHNIGMVVAYAYAAQFPGDVKKIAGLFYYLRISLVRRIFAGCH
jgi:hypothetical protein